MSNAAPQPTPTRQADQPAPDSQTRTHPANGSATACIGVHVGMKLFPTTDESRTRSSTHAVVLLGRPLPTTVLTSLTTALARLDVAVHLIRRLADQPVTARELLVSARGCATEATAMLRSAATEVTAGDGVDIAVEPISRRRWAKRLVVFDVDSTLLRAEVIDLLAARAGREREVRAITEAAMRGNIDFTESLHRRVAALADLPAAVLEEVAAHAKFSRGVRLTVRTLRRLGFRCGAVSGGFNQVVQPVATELGLEFFAANELEIKDGRLTGQIIGEVIDRQGKAAVLRRFASFYGIPLSQCVAVGDGANDIDMLTTAGLGIAFNAKPALREIADTALSQPSMEAILFVLGISDDVIGYYGQADEPQLSTAIAS
jgi:phosphoserine phosphatase